MNMPDPKNPNGTDPDTTRNELIAIKSELAMLQRELNRISASESHVIVTIKWLMGVLVTLTALLIGGNWVVNKSNYDRDRQFLQEESDLISKKLLLDQQAANDRNLGAIQADVQSWISTTGNSLTNSFMELESSVDEQLADSSNQLASVFLSARGGILMVQTQEELKNQDFLNAAKDYILAATDFYDSQRDNHNLSTCVSMLLSDCLPKINQADFQKLSYQNVQYSMDLLISDIATLPSYYDDANRLKSERQRLTGEPYQNPDKEFPVSPSPPIKTASPSPEKEN
jgi:hypothetical protein